MNEILRDAFEDMIKMGWRLDNVGPEEMNKYFELALEHLENVFDGEEELQDEHLGFIIDFLLTIKKMDKTLD